MRVALLTLAGFLLALPCRAFWWWGSSEDSIWPERPITVDGDSKEWDLRYSDDDDGLTFAFANDGANFYLMVSPHTKVARDQMNGTYGQDFIIWLNTQAQKKQKMGIKLLAPKEGQAASERLVELISIDTSAAASSADNGGIDVSIGPLDEHGVLEARIPLSYFGSPLPKKIAVELEATKPTKPLPKIKAGSTQSGASSLSPGRHSSKGRQFPADDEADYLFFEPIQLWIRVTLATKYGL